MGAKRAIAHHRAKQHAHALERLQERYWPDATLRDVIALRDLAALAAPAARGIPGTDVKALFIPYRDRLVHVIYAPRFNAVRTVIPCQTRQDRIK